MNNGHFRVADYSANLPVTSENKPSVSKVPTEAVTLDPGHHHLSFHPTLQLHAGKSSAMPDLSSSMHRK